MRKKCIVSDLDGTLLKEGEERLPEEFFDGIRELRSRKIDFVVASGRSYGDLKKLLAPVLYEVTMICEEGAAIIQKGKMLHCRPISRETVEHWVKEAKRQKAELLLAGKHTCYTEYENEGLRSRYQKQRRAVMPVRDVREVTEPVLRMSFFLGSGEKGGWIRRKGEKDHEVRISFQDESWLDLVLAEADKGSALQWLLKERGLSVEEVLVFGDNTNDIPMFHLVPDSFAMKWAKEEVRREAGYESACVMESVREFLKRQL
ncbi:HAD-IIB family hydrolase [Clostridiaceae bacterium 68-1-5]|uniref:HAD-IIB family hydrolase n=1 Tax=Suipraeoptans intestinalis TaxID=2606628 RepID=A0A6N7V0Y2_9FIRM|nr:HAD family hydrolase [Suipraeoptans intestinalis]MSR93516.1 HAD-IIB family hydrolase [Suipraeoptans intestinalis]